MKPAGASIRGSDALAVGPVTPLVVRGPAPVLHGRRHAAAGERRHLTRLLDLYRHTDPRLAPVLEERMGLAAHRARRRHGRRCRGRALGAAGIAQVRA